MRDALTGLLAAWFSGRGRLQPDFFAVHCRSWYERRGGVPWLCCQTISCDIDGFIGAPGEALGAK